MVFPTRREKLEYLQQMQRDLRDIALSAQCPMLTYLIEMAYVEASNQLRRLRATELETEARSHHAA